MSKVLIVVEENREGVTDSPMTIRMVSALKAAIATSSKPSATVQVVASNTLLQHIDSFQVQDSNSKEIIICPLTLNLPSMLFEFDAVYQACRDVSGLRQRLRQQVGCSVADGCFWLPVVLTAKGPLYGEVIAALAEEKQPKDLLFCDLNYYQPFHASDALRQQLYQMGHQLLHLLDAPPATYLMQFALKGEDVSFDRLLPFPAAPAIASLSLQQPDLFACHWYCLTSLPILDLIIVPPVMNQASS